MGFADELRKFKDQIEQNLRLGWAHWDNLVDKVERVERREIDDYNDEQVWTFLLACLYAVDSESGPNRLAQLLTDGATESNVICFEVLPPPPRDSEGKTHLDLALGDVTPTTGTDSGIELAPCETPSICFCEFKWYSDISKSVSYDEHRNQLARVIENALMFRSAAGNFARSVHVTLATPAVFRDRPAPSRLYRYKWREYDESREALLADLKHCRLRQRGDLPDPRDRIEALSLHWVSFEQLAFSAPATGLREGFKKFYLAHKGPELLNWPVG